MKNIKVKNVIISKQPEISKNFEDFFQIVNEKKINVIMVNRGDTIFIEQDVYFHILWPDSNSFLSENALNNNSIVCKLYYKKFSILFTGDIEKIAEQKILNIYSNNLEILHSDILKVAHHGSKTSSTEEFVKAVNPKEVLIGVGEENKFGHPSSDVIDRFYSLGIWIYRTDRMGEIDIRVNSNSMYVIDYFIKSD